VFSADNGALGGLMAGLHCRTGSLLLLLLLLTESRYVNALQTDDSFVTPLFKTRAIFTQYDVRFWRSSWLEEPCPF